MQIDLYDRVEKLLLELRQARKDSNNQDTNWRIDKSINALENILNCKKFFGASCQHSELQVNNTINDALDVLGA